MDGMASPETLIGQAGGAEHRQFGRLRLLTVADARNMPPRDFLLYGLIAAGELSVWWGPPKCGKSFLTLRIAYALALGLPMWDRKSERCSVIYIAAEGQTGFSQRVRAISDRMGDAPGFAYIGQAVDLFSTDADTASIIAAAKAVGARLVVIDTVARAMPGADENSQRDVGLFIRNCDRIREETGAHVALVHHGKADGEWSRGSTALPGAVDLSVRVTASGQGVEAPRKAEVMHAKDDASGFDLPFRLTMAELPPVDEQARWTCVAEEVDDETALLAGASFGSAGPRLSPQHRRALDLLQNTLAVGGRPAPAGVLLIPGDRLVVTEDEWRQAVYAGTVTAGETQDARRKAFKRAAESLVAARKIGIHNGLVWTV